jgi:predicted dehydrogenase
VILANPNPLHEDGALVCIAAGVPALIEKQLAGDVAAAERIVAAGEAAGVALLVGHHRRHNPQIAAVIRGAAAPRASEGLATQRAIAAIAASARTGQPVIP